MEKAPARCRTKSGNGETGPWGWGYELISLFAAAKIHVYNEGRGGRSSRGYIEEGAWVKILAQLAPGDFVILHFGITTPKIQRTIPTA
jgi:rhamnogalacturonan acetylesterase